jgi:hypothetical protein
VAGRQNVLRLSGIPLQAIEAFCRRHRIRRLSLFGSAVLAVSDRRATLTLWWSSSLAHVWGFCSCAACSVSLRRFSAALWTPCRARV